MKLHFIFNDRQHALSRACMNAEMQINLQPTIYTYIGIQYATFSIYQEYAVLNNSKIALKAPEGGWSEEGYRYFFILDHPLSAFESIIEGEEVWDLTYKSNVQVFFFKVYIRN